MVKWAIELSEYDVDFEPRTAIKAQALADFIQETNRAEIPEPWRASVDGSVTKEGCGVGLHIRSPSGDDLQFAIKYEQRLSNNEAEYEALIRALQIMVELGAESVHVKSDSQLVVQQVLGEYDVRENRMAAYHVRARELMDKFQDCHIEQVPREQNNRADLLARMASAVEQSWTGSVTLLFEPSSGGGPEVFGINEQEDWRSPIIHFLRTGEKLDPVISQRCLYGRYCLVNDQLYKRSFTHPLLKCLSPVEAQFAVKEIHQGCCGSHAGYKDLMRKLVRAGFYWPTMGEDAKSFVKRCEACQRFAPRINVPGETMGAMYATCPFDKWGIDIVGKLPTAPGGKCFLIVAVDYFSKWVEAEAVVKVDEVTIEKFLWRNICCRYGSPRVLVSDNGSQFTGKRVEGFCHRMDIVQRFVSVAHPQANGQVELTNRTICEGLKKRLEKCKGRWAEELDGVLWAHRTSPKTATGEAPFTLVYGSNAVIPAEVRLASHRILHYDPIQNDELRRLDLDLIDLCRDEAVLRAAKYKSIIKAGYDKKVVVRKFTKGDLVLKRVDALHPSRKFDPTWEGPFVVTEVLGGGAYHLSDGEGRPLTRPWNINTLKKFYA